MAERGDHNRGNRVALIGAAVAVLIAIGIGGAILFAHQQREAQRAVAASHVHQILMGLMAYAADHGGRLPDEMRTLVMRGYVSGDTLRNPITGDMPGFAYTKPADTLGEVRMPMSVPVIRELRDGEPINHGVTGHIDGSTRFVEPSD